LSVDFDGSWRRACPLVTTAIKKAVGGDMENKIFFWAIFVSFLVHMAFFVRFYVNRDGNNLFEKMTDVKYRIEKTVSEKERVSPEVVIHKIEPDVRPDAQIIAGLVPKNISQEEKFFKDQASGMADMFKVYERQPERVKGLKVTKDVSMPVLKSEKINSPAYVTYYQIVRDRIRERAYTNYTKLSVGEIYLTFIIKSDGTLGELQIIENRSTANEFLREVGQKSVREASPFPPFPEDLNYPELTFNVAISFQYHEE